MADMDDIFSENMGLMQELHSSFDNKTAINDNITQIKDKISTDINAQRDVNPRNYRIPIWSSDGH